jgi:hypothetical protein
LICSDMSMSTWRNAGRGAGWEAGTYRGALLGRK